MLISTSVEMNGHKCLLLCARAAVETSSEGLDSRSGPSRKRSAPGTASRPGGPVGEVPVFGKSSAKSCSLSAVSAPIFASEYAFCSIFQNIPDYPAECFEIWQNENFANFATFAKLLLNFHEKC